MRDAVDDGVFDERLQKQRREKAVLRLSFDLSVDVQAFAKANFFNGQEALQQFQFLTQGNKGSFAEAQRHTQKISEQDAHIARAAGIDAGQGADGIEAVE